MEIQHSRHHHPLILTNRDIRNDGFDCDMCKYNICRGSFYYCDQCTFAIHYRCAVTLPQHVNHPFHPHHPLTLLTENRSYECSFCMISDLDKSYACIECNFGIHVDCALLPTITCQGIDENIQRLCHLQPMALVENYAAGVDHGGKKFECYVCESPCQSGSPTFVCTVCQSFFHKSCTELPLKNKSYPFCSDLFFRIVWEPDANRSCDSCFKDPCIFIYECKHFHRRIPRSFFVCVRCFLERPTVRFQGHAHLLCVIENVHRVLEHCNGVNDSYCQQSSVPRELNCTASIILQCVPCRFSLHLLCGPLPCTIKHKCHIHPLTLCDSIIEDDSGEYYCDACETERDPRLCVYCCADCKYIAHVHCVVSEVTRALKGNLRDAELTMVGQRKFGTELRKQKVESDNDTHQNASVEEEVDTEGCIPLWYIVYGLLSEKELSALDIKNEKKQSKLTQVAPEETRIQPNSSYYGQMEFPSYTKYDPTEFIKGLHNEYDDSQKLILPEKDLYVKSVKVGGYMVTWNLAHILRDLIAKYGDISEESQLSVEMRSLPYYFLCRVINSMRRTLVIYITEDILKEWYFCLEKVKRYGFKIDFVYARLEPVVRAYLGLQATKFENDTTAKLDQDIAMIQEQIVRLQAELERRKKHRVEYRPQINNASKKPDFREECLSEASMLKWKTAGENLL